MKKTFIKVLIFCFIFVSLLIIKREITPFYIGNLTFKVKFEDYTKRNEKFNAVIFGSSSLYRHANTPFLDSLLNKYDLSTYNFATGGTYNPEAYFLYENFLQCIDSGEIKTAFLEVQQLRTYLAENRKTTRASYWNTEKYLKYSIEYIKDSYYPSEKKYDMYTSFIDSYLYGFYDFSILPNLFRHGNVKEVGKNGFYSLDEALNENMANTTYEDRWNDFHYGTGKLKLAQRINAAQIVPESVPQEALNKTHLKYLNHLIKKSYNKGIYLFLVLPPRFSKDEYYELVKLFNSLPSLHSIQLYQYSKHQELYEVENSFDFGHLNSKGADIFTKHLAIEVENINARKDNNVFTN